MEPRFKNVVYEWFHFMDYVLGLDTVGKNSNFHAYTVFVVLIFASFPISSLWTFYSDDGDKAIEGGSNFFVTVKVPTTINSPLQLIDSFLNFFSSFYFPEHRSYRNFYFSCHLAAKSETQSIFSTMSINKMEMLIRSDRFSVNSSKCWTVF